MTYSCYCGRYARTKHRGCTCDWCKVPVRLHGWTFWQWITTRARKLWAHIKWNLC